MVVDRSVGPLGRPHTRRQVLTAALVGGGVVATGGAAAVVLLTRGGDDTPAAPGATATPTAGSPTPTATATPGAPLGFLEPASDAFEQREFAKDEAIDWNSGVFYMNTSTGRMMAYRLRQGEPHMVSSAGPRFILAWGRDQATYLADRTTGDTWKWVSPNWRVVAASASRVVFADLDQAYGRENGHYIIADAGMSATIPVSLEGVGWSQWLTRKEQAAVARTGLRDTVSLVDLVTGDAATIFTAPAEIEGKHPWRVDLIGEWEETFRARVTYYAGQPNEQSGPSGLPNYLLQRLSFSGDVLDSSYGEAWFESVSPDGRQRLRQVDLHSAPPEGEGSGESWPAVLQFDADAPVLRVRSAALTYGDRLPDRRWLADGSGFVAMVRDDSPVRPANPYAYGIVSRGGVLERLPRIPVEVDDWYTRPSTCGPAPSPTNPDLLSFGRFYLYNRRSGEWFIPRLPTPQNGPAHLSLEDSPWVGAPDEMVFALNHGGHGGGSPPALIAPLVEPAGFPADPPMRFRVAGTGSCLNLRSGPGIESGVVACLADGAVLTLHPEGQYLWENATQKYTHSFDASGPFVMVRTEDGREGWVSTQYLEWA